MPWAHKFVRLLPVLLFVNPILLYADDVYPLRVKVLSSQFQELNGGTPVPKDCDMANFSAYCNESKNPSGQNIITLQGADGTSFTVMCTIDSRWSKCAALPVGETFQARREKRGITILTRDSKGKDSKQFYQLLSAVPSFKSTPPADSRVPAVAPPSSPAPSAAVAPAQTPPTPAASPTRSAQEVVPEKVQKVKCNFSSTPPGADIILDGQYMGSTPSGISVSTGTHSVVFSMPGFTEWKRDLTVLPGSELTVSAILQKEQQ
jgi:hypothetical protein